MDPIPEKSGLLQRFILWREKHVSESQFVLLLSIIVGVLTAIAARLLKLLIEGLQHLLTSNFNAMGSNWLYLVYPVIGIFITSLFIRYVVKDDIGHGVTKILYAISRRKSRIKRHNCWSSLIASAITIGFGGSVGAESPIVLTGSAIGSNLGSVFKLDHKTLMLLVGCGAAGAIAGIYKAPIAGMLFVLEVLMIDLTMNSLLPLLVTSVSAAIVSYLLTGTQALFEFHMVEPFILKRVPSVIILGIACGLVSVYFTRMMDMCENVFRRYSNPYTKLAIGGITLSLLIFFFPSLYGEGYDTVGLLINGKSDADWNMVMRNSFFSGDGNMLLVYLSLIVLVKVFASSATNGGGGCGGLFAPSLFLGAISGFIFAHFCNVFDIGTFTPEQNFALYGMAGLMTGVMHAPLTSTFLIAELTGGYDLFLPLMIVSATAYLTNRAFQSQSIYAIRLAKKGELLTHHKDKAVLTLLNIDSVVETDFLKVTPDMDLGQMIQVISRSKRNLFPVVDNSDKLLGIVVMDDIRNIMFRQELYHRFRVQRFMISPPARVIEDDTMETVMKKFDDTKAWNLPVVKRDGTYLGFVSKSEVFDAYRQVLVNFSQE
ncbi:MAG: chloride channel protein [Phocaeicola sp.]|uniref:chloride channel protein n=1 Tax=Phocaeicola TaxID=909656 RepID=UPI00234F500C|nr:chloride channel protein [Phocaeicola oris]MCE2616211.1 chloride channel protein [Phocaeicola oris]